MECHKFRELMAEPLDFLPDSALGKEIAAHKDGCLQCRVEWERTQEVWERLSDIRSISPSGEFNRKLLMRVEKEGRGEKLFKRFFGEPVLAAATVMAAAILTFSLFSGRDDVPEYKSELPLFSYDMEMMNYMELFLEIEELEELDLVDLNG